MTKNQFLTALKTLGLGVASKDTAEALGLSIRQLLRIAAGDSAVTPMLANLLAMYLKHGLPKR